MNSELFWTNRHSGKTSLMMQALGRASGLPVAEIRLDGAACLATLDISTSELERRTESHLGAVTDRQVLSALWESATSTAVETERQSSVNQVAPPAQPYSPIGSVQSLSFYGSRSIDQAAEWPPTFERIAFLDSPTIKQIELADATGVGVAAVTADRDIHFTVSPQPPIVGRSGLFRWWVAELCFASLLRQAPKR